MPALTAEMLKDFRARWAAVNAVTRAEGEGMTPEERRRQMGYVMRLARVPEMLARRDDGEGVRERWRLLRSRLGS